MLTRKNSPNGRILVAVFVFLVQVAYAGAQRKNSAPATATKVVTLDQVWTLDATYTDRQHGVSFRYPSVWKATKGFGYIPPLLANGQQPTAGFGYSEGGFPRESVVGPYSATNLEGFGIAYSATRATNGSACETLASSLSQSPKQRNVMLGGRSFSERSTSQGGMSHAETGRLYAIFVRPTCYLFETELEVTSAADDVHNLSPDELKLIDKKLFSIMETVRILSQGRASD